MSGDETATVLNDFALSAHFNLREFMCPCCLCVKIHPALIEALEKIRRYLGQRPVVVTSGYRCPDHNSKIGGASSSDHLFGWAADIVVQGVAPQRIARAAASFSQTVKRIGTYPDRNCVHIGVVSRPGLPSRWGGWWV